MTARSFYWPRIGSRHFHLHVTTARSLAMSRKTAQSFSRALSNGKPDSQRQMPQQPQKMSATQQDAMPTSHALAATTRKDWIINLEANSHMCYEQSLFKDFVQLKSMERIVLGNGNSGCRRRRNDTYA